MKLPPKPSRKRTKRFDKLYTRIVGDVCIYCGDPKEHEDHCPPLQWVVNLDPEAFDNFYLVPSCAECNYVLGSKDLFKVTERQQFIYEHLRVTQWNLRMQEPHDPDTVARDFQGRLQAEVRTQIFRQLRAWARFEFAKEKVDAINRSA